MLVSSVKRKKDTKTTARLVTRVGWYWLLAGEEETKGRTARPLAMQYGQTSREMRWCPYLRAARSKV